MKKSLILAIMMCLSFSFLWSQTEVYYLDFVYERQDTGVEEILNFEVSAGATHADNVRLICPLLQIYQLEFVPERGVFIYEAEGDFSAMRSQYPDGEYVLEILIEETVQSAIPFTIDGEFPDYPVFTNLNGTETGLQPLFSWNIEDGDNLSYWSLKIFNEDIHYHRYLPPRYREWFVYSMEAFPSDESLELHLSAYNGLKSSAASFSFNTVLSNESNSVDFIALSKEKLHLALPLEIDDDGDIITIPAGEYYIFIMECKGNNVQSVEVLTPAATVLEVEYDYEYWIYDSFDEVGLIASEHDFDAIFPDGLYTVTITYTDNSEWKYYYYLDPEEDYPSFDLIYPVPDETTNTSFNSVLSTDRYKFINFFIMTSDMEDDIWESDESYPEALVEEGLLSPGENYIFEAMVTWKNRGSMIMFPFETKAQSASASLDDAGFRLVREKDVLNGSEDFYFEAFVKGAEVDAVSLYLETEPAVKLMDLAYDSDAGYFKGRQALTAQEASEFNNIIAVHVHFSEKAEPAVYYTLVEGNFPDYPILLFPTPEDAEGGFAANDRYFYWVPGRFSPNFETMVESNGQTMDSLRDHLLKEVSYPGDIFLPPNPQLFYLWAINRGKASLQTMEVSYFHEEDAPMTLGEALDAPELPWRTGGDAPWFVQEETWVYGGAAARSGAITHNQVSWIETDIEGPGVLSFYWKVSSEDYFDWLEVLVNEVSAKNRISGEIGWHLQNMRLDPGLNTVRWEYTKDEAVDWGEDSGWLDRVVFIPGISTSVSHWQLFH